MQQVMNVTGITGMKRPEFDICVIGGGSAGLVVAAGGASLGAKVVLVEKDALGGDCLHYGCIPSKTLLYSAKVAHTIRHARRYGIDSAPPAASIKDVMQRVGDVIKTIEVHDSPERFRGMGVDVIFGAGRFVSTDTFRIDDRVISAKHFVIATGSRPSIPPIAGLDTVPFLTNVSVFSIEEPVPELVILGGGPIGIEMAQAFVRLGSKVTVIQRNTQILTKEDQDISKIVKQRLEDEGVEFQLGSTTQRISGSAGEIELTFAAKDGQQRSITGTHLLVATGRKANSEGLGLENAQVRTQNGRIMTDNRLRTTNRRIFACGDIVGPYLFTHMAEHHAGVVLRNALFRLPAKIEQRVIPWCTFTDPELARTGLSETEAQQIGIRHKVYTFPFRDIDRAQTEGETDGIAKIITDLKGRLLGAALVGPNAGELIHEYIIAIAKRMKASDLSGIIHIYPTLAQINRRVADARMKEGLTPGVRKWIKRIFRLRGT